MSEGRFEVNLASVAEDDLETLYDYICQTRNVASANLLLAEIHKIVASLQLFPERGAHPDELADAREDNVRQLIRWPYRAIYEISGHSVEIFAVVDGRRDLRTMLNQRIIAR